MGSTTEIATNRAAGPDLLVRRWLPAGEPWAALMLIHGLAEHSGRYEHVGDELAAAGIAVEAFDNRGAGGSGGRRAYVDRFADFHADLAERLAALHASVPDRPLVLFGHSLGGLIVLGYMIDDHPKPDLLVLSAPAIEDSLPGWKRALVRTIGAIAPTLEVSNGLDGAWLAADPEVGRRYVADPLAHHRSTVRLATRGFAEQRRVIAGLDRLSLPMLVYHGEVDPIVPCSSSERLALLPSVTRRTYPGLRHETHNEPGSTVVADMIAWLRAQVDGRRPESVEIG